MSDNFNDFIDNFDIDLKPVNHVVFLIDVSGSMQGKEKFIVDSFNEQLKVIQQNKDQKTYISLIYFSNEYNIELWEERSDSVDFLSESDVNIYGMTLFFDTFGDIISKISKDVPELQNKSKNHSVLFIVITDGFDNLSKRYSYDVIKSMMKELEVSETWTFTFAGVDFDAIGSFGGLSFTGNTINFQSIDSTSAIDAFKSSISDYYTLRSSGETRSMNYYNSNYYKTK